MPDARSNLFDSLRLAESRLCRAEVDSPRLSAELLMAMILGVDRLWVLTHLDSCLDSDQLHAYFEAVGLRATGCPVAYLTGRREFFGRDFRVTPQVLIPRPETEALLEWAQSLWPPSADLRFADAGTGCGAIGVCVASLFPHSRGVLTDRSDSALRIARENAANHDVSSRLRCVCSDLVSACRLESLDAVLSNPPYISSVDYWRLSHEIRLFEPGPALWGGMRGIEVQVRLIKQAQGVLRAGGWLGMEIGNEQFSALQEVMQTQLAHIWTDVGVVQDLAGRDRVLTAKKV